MESTKPDSEAMRLKIAGWEKEQLELCLRANIPKWEMFCFGCELTPRTTVVRTNEGGKINTRFVHRHFALPMEELMPLIDAYKQTEPAFAEQLLQDVKESQALLEPLPALTHIGGMDISFFPDSRRGIATLVIIQYPQLEKVKVFMEECELAEEYVVGYLGFREAPPLQQLWENSLPGMRASKCVPQLLVVDGCGTHHARKAGLAVHLGVLLDLPTIGCAKNMLEVDGVTTEEVYAALSQKWEQFSAAGPPISSKMSSLALPLYPIIGHSRGDLYGYAVMTSNSSKKCLYVSPGNHMGFAMSVAIVQLVRRYRIPEPTRLADLDSREFIRQSRSKSVH